jgi:ribonuclease P protein component
MLPRSFRVNKEKDINRFFGLNFRKARGLSWSTKNLLIKVLPNNFEHGRFGFIVNTKLDNRASVRNLVKRRLREIARLNMPKTAPKMDYLVLTFPPAKKLDYHELEKDFLFILKRLNLLK